MNVDYQITLAKIIMESEIRSNNDRETLGMLDSIATNIAWGLDNDKRIDWFTIGDICDRREYALYSGRPDDNKISEASFAEIYDQIRTLENNTKEKLSSLQK